MIGTILWLIYLLIRIPNARCLVALADDGLVAKVWCKPCNGFSADDGILMEDL